MTTDPDVALVEALERFSGDEIKVLARRGRRPGHDLVVTRDSDGAQSGP